MSGVVVIGVGNPFRGDDAAGLRAVALARPDLPAGVAVVECDGEPTRLLAAWDGAAVALVADAVRSGAPPGTMHRLEPGPGGDLPARGRIASSHGLGVGEALALGRALGRLPRRLVVYGIEGERYDDGAGLSAAAARGAATAAAALAREAADLAAVDPEEGARCA